MTNFSDPPPWAFEICPSCGRDVPLKMHDLTCPQFDKHTRAAVAWICDDCDCVLHTVGLFTSWAAANYARKAELDLRWYQYVDGRKTASVDTFTTQSRRRGIK
ncbi:MAG TPA: hypothetical protein VNL16_15215 [Chloroflexota bacterium]|nr:hypothetical protein [Chloroflexota bacterium]